MRSRLTPQVIGTVPETDLIRMIKRVIDEELQFYDSPTIKFLLTTRGITAKAKIPPGGGTAGWSFGPKIELPAAPYPAYPAQTVIHIQSTNAIVTTGIVDAANPSGPLVQSQAGLWVSTQAVPAQTTVDGVDCWNLPHLPLPDAANYDDDSNFWLYITGDALCY